MSDTLRSLIQELIDDPPRSVCADNGESCAFCGSEYRYHIRYNATVDHDPGCWLLRADAVLGGAD